tara:strand:+ start:236 stop:958 length:723 start_codon:yes stop_codon:yes gene_type:complete
MNKKLFNSLYYFVNILKRKIKSKKEYYSLTCADALVNYIFKNKKKGFYVDVGCNHPIYNNNTYLLFKRGWGGINIDLDKKNIELFEHARKKDFNVHAAVSSKVGEKNLFFYHDKSPINTLSNEASSFQKAEVKEVKKIKTRTLDDIIKESPFKDEKIDFLSIDVEGHEKEVLEGFDINRYSPKIVVIEYLDLTLKKLEIKNLNIDNVIKSDLYNYMINNNYNLVNWVHSDLVFSNKNFRD